MGRPEVLAFVLSAACGRDPLGGIDGEDSGGTETSGTSGSESDTQTTGTTGTSDTDTTTAETGTETGPDVDCDAAEYDEIAPGPLLFDIGPMQLAIGPDDRPQVFYSTLDAVWHATPEGGGWETTAHPHDVVRRFGANVDRNSAAHLAYDHGGQLHYHTNAGGSWTSETADLGSCVVSSLIVGEDDAVHVAGVVDEVLCYGMRSPDGEWSVQTIVQAFPRGTSIALDSGQPHITYYRPGAMHAYEDQGWHSTSIGSGGIDNDMIMGPGGTLLMGHSESPFGTVLLSWNDGQGWQTHELRDSSGGLNTAAPRVAVDGQDTIHLVFPRGDDGCLQHATATDPSGPWTIEDVIPDAEYFGWIAVDSKDQAYVAYAQKGGPRPVLATLD